jgi:hypothetical protein
MWTTECPVHRKFVHSQSVDVSCVQWNACELQKYDGGRPAPYVPPPALALRSATAAPRIRMKHTEPWLIASAVSISQKRRRVQPMLISADIAQPQVAEEEQRVVAEVLGIQGDAVPPQAPPTRRASRPSWLPGK